MAHQAGTYPGFCSMKRLGVFLPPPPGWDARPLQGYPPALNLPVPIYTGLACGTISLPSFNGLHIDQDRSTVEPRFNEVDGERPNLFIKWRVRYIENRDITNLTGKYQKVCYIKVIVND